MFISTQIAVLEAELDELWDRREKLVDEIKAASTHLQSGLKAELDALVKRYETTLEELNALRDIRRS